jgi:hypothetical protein
VLLARLMGSSTKAQEMEGKLDMAECYNNLLSASFLSIVYCFHSSVFRRC